ncbi:hypothetical protein BJF78_09380 [Pseudonocardia sp. CNS-139]|nr:hypothetical protein BJF78_09380 [Pseudonocardia sp. CNS-139]
MSFQPLAVLVTGASAGVGHDTAARLAAAGHRVVLHGRTQEAGERAAAQLAAGGADPDLLSVVAADFTRLDDVVVMAKQVAAGCPALDVLVNTVTVAGSDQRALTENGNELQFQVNYLAPYLLIRGLAEPLAQSAAARVIAVSSVLHRGARLDWTDPNRDRRYTKLTAFAQSQLALTIFTSSLAGSVTAISVDPGPTDRRVLRLHRTGTLPAADAADVLARLCDPAVELVNGAFYDRLQPTAAVPPVGDRRAHERLRKLTDRLTTTACVPVRSTSCCCCSRSPCSSSWCAGSSPEPPEPVPAGQYRVMTCLTRVYSSTE